ncbi:hypothetical protein C8F04DRAFT_1184336 [Mycena alexandri]|uniref:Uncharacterized protein n=1 Tax=Mycena alexandri TaxID=1745969 RepID=A0AAD6SSW9_9AGAR|nr:hypothetical protein C8F04DRAFT_1184336 [Mycena alexandri]
MVTIAEDIAEEEPKGQVGGIGEETAGPALKEFMHIVRMLHAADDSLVTPNQRASHLAFFMRLLSHLAPFLITSWSNTMNCCVCHGEPQLLFRSADMAKVNNFFNGQSHNASKIIPDEWYSAGRRTHGEDANLRREIFLVIYGGVVEPAMAIIERDLLDNGLLDSAVDDDDHLSASCPGEGDYSDEDTASDATSDEDNPSDTEDHGVQRRLRFRGYIEVAATGKVARQAQLERLVEEAKRTERLGLPVDPLGFAPFGTTLTSPEFAKCFMVLADRKDLGQWGGLGGRIPATNQAMLDSHKNIGLWNKAQVVERCVLLDTKAEAHGLAPETVHERSHHPAQLSAFIKAVQGAGIAAKHYCVKDPDNPLTLTESSFPSLQHLVYTHDVLNNPDLNTFLTDRPDLIFRTVASVLGPAELQAALPLDYTNYDLSICTTPVYLPAVLRDEMDLWECAMEGHKQCCLVSLGKAEETGKLSSPDMDTIKKMSVQGRTQEHSASILNCSTCKWKEINSMVNLPAEFSQFFWLLH